MSEEATKILNDAIDILNERGHCKGMLFDPDTGRVCAMGALNMATLGEAFGPWTQASLAALNMATLSGAFGLWTQDSLRRREAMDRLREQMPKESSAHYPVDDNIPIWNDDPNTSTEDVLLAFKKAASE